MLRHDARHRSPGSGQGRQTTKYRVDSSVSHDILCFTAHPYPACRPRRRVPTRSLHEYE